MRGPLRMGVASSLLSLAVLPDCVCGQQAGPVPPAPPPAAAGAPALEGPRSDLEPIPQVDSRRERAREQLAQADEPWTHDALKAGEEPGRAPKVYTPKAPRRRLPNGRRAGGRVGDPSGFPATGTGTPTAGSFPGWQACGEFLRGACSGRTAAGYATRTDGIAYRVTGARGAGSARKDHRSLPQPRRRGRRQAPPPSILLTTQHPRRALIISTSRAIMSRWPMAPCSSGSPASGHAKSAAGSGFQRGGSGGRAAGNIGQATGCVSPSRPTCVPRFMLVDRLVPPRQAPRPASIQGLSKPTLTPSRRRLRGAATANPVRLQPASGPRASLLPCGGLCLYPIRECHTT